MGFSIYAKVARERTRSHGADDQNIGSTLIGDNAGEQRSRKWMRFSGHKAAAALYAVVVIPVLGLGIWTMTMLPGKTEASYATSAISASGFLTTTNPVSMSRRNISHGMTAALRCLSLNNYHEARSEPFQGQVAVAQVVLRRANYDTRRVCRVVYKSHQFSWTAAKPKVRDRAAWATAVRAAQVAMLPTTRDYSRGATHYHTTAVCPRWSTSMGLTTVIGEHEFYRRK